MDDVDDANGANGANGAGAGAQPQAAAGTPESLEVRHPGDGRLVATVPVPGEAAVDAALDAAVAAGPELAALPAHARADVLAEVSRRILAEQDALARTITDESGKPLKYAAVEAQRAAATFRWAAEEARRWSGDLQRLDTEPSGAGRLALIRRFPRGPVLGIAPFNFPLNLVAHKLAPALAVGAPIVVKPAPRTPLSALRLAGLVHEAAAGVLPEAAVTVLPVPDPRAPALVDDPRLPVVSFTGSVPVGWRIRHAVPRKQVVLELGGDGPALVFPDADLDHAAARIAAGGHAQGGQVCIAVQRVLAHRDVYADLAARVVAATEKLVVGDPYDPATDVGPLIDEAAARRVEAWVEEAVRGGARVLTGGRREGALYRPTVLENVQPTAQVVCQEVFGPVVVLAPFDTVEEAFAQVNASRFGLQVGVFTGDLQLAFRAHRELEVGGVIVGDIPTFRADQMPYGGTKDSGTGREGVRWAMEDYTEPRTLVLSGVL